MKYSLLSCFLGLAIVGDAVGAVHLNLKGKRRSANLDTLRRRGNINGQVSLTDSADISYTANLTLGGAPFTVMIDTGSSDLWVAGSVPNANTTAFTSGVSYAVGSVSGPVKTAQLNFAGWTVPNQAYIEVTPGDQKAGTGLIGLGPSSGSNIRVSMGNVAAGDPVLDRIFNQNTTTPNYLTVLMGRSGDPSEPYPGDLTIGEILPGYENISNQTKLPVTQVSVANKGGQHWQLLLDDDGIYGPNGKAIPITTAVGATSDKNQATAVLDTGFTLPQVPKTVSDAIYSGVKDAQYTNIQGIGNVWAVPCTAEINLSFKFGGQVIPIHPLDVSLDGTDLQLNLTSTDTGEVFCIGAFQPVSFDAGSSPTFDIILGMSFLRNSYTMINFGDFVDGTTNRASPYIQLLATTNDTQQAHNDFVKVRLQGVDNGQSPNNTQDHNGSPSVSAAQNFISKYRYYILAAAGAILLLGLISLCICMRSRRRKGAVVSSGGWKRNPSAYAPLHDPAPNAAMDLHAMPSGHESKYSYDANSYHSYNSMPYNPPAQGNYSNPFDRR